MNQDPHPSVPSQGNNNDCKWHNRTVARYLGETILQENILLFGNFHFQGKEKTSPQNIFQATPLYAQLHSSPFLFDSFKIF
jgi:hypothetical protein